MSNTGGSVKLERLIDANLNRLKEGIRVIEEIARFIFDDTTLTPRLKLLRHQLQKAYNSDRISHRDIENDIQRESIASEMHRATINDIVIANFSRAQESSRVLEESYKLIDAELAELFKSIRYELYALEKLYFSQFNAQ
jgi:thiamine-phosphate pyrophosphorylase